MKCERCDETTETFGDGIEKNICPSCAAVEVDRANKHNKMWPTVVSREEALRRINKDCGGGEDDQNNQEVD